MTATDTAPKAPHELEIDKLLAKGDDAVWRVPQALAKAMPYAVFALTVEQKHRNASHVLHVDITLPMPVMPDVMAARFRLPRELPQYRVTLTEDQWCGLCATATLFGMPVEPLSMLALLVGEVLALLQIPNGRRPFAEKWTTAIRGLAQVTNEMHWQGLAIVFNRDIVSRVMRHLRADLSAYRTQWGSHPEAS